MRAPGRRIGAAAMALAAAACALAGCAERRPDAEDFLRQAWDAYKAAYVAREGYVVDVTRGDGEAISEAQGYALLRAAWMCDEATFDRVLGWTDRHLLRPDGLYAWRWSVPRREVLDPNTATDAEQEIALALILAARGFARPDLEDRARTLLRAVRRHTAIAVGDGWFPSAGNWAVAQRIVNPSYFLPYAYHDFARIDPESGWEAALDAGYAIVDRLAARSGRPLPPDFLVVARDGALEPLPEGVALSQDFSFDAMRLYFRVALDCALYPRPQACDAPLDVAPLARLLDRDGAIYTRYATDGTPLSADESLSFYAGLLPFLAQRSPEHARALAAGRLDPRRLRPILEARDRYYDLNWIWFGIAAAEGVLADRRDLVCAGDGAAGAVRRPAAAANASATGGR